ncbi:2TM domain-containing protein [Herbaspirillum sp. B65]|uniref:2TM domain-containing protein n=1 Tax=Herbaspirillum sp. B65 TaxID=137708 RepID=UPI0003492D72|nr:2TM domain-containing protein [Herbaspirillum sp. B65]
MAHPWRIFHPPSESIMRPSDTTTLPDPSHPSSPITAADHDRAERRVERQLGFFRHLAIYLAVNAGLLLLNLAGPHDHWWSLGPLLGWGIGVLFHALSVFGRLPASWKQAMIARELRRR